jgi:hypothetical protein
MLDSINQNLFDAIHSLTGHIPLQSEMQDILSAIELDNLQEECEHNFVYKIMHDHKAADICTKCKYIKFQK